MHLKHLKHRNLIKNLFLMIILIIVPVIIFSTYLVTYWSSYIKNAEFEKDTKFLSLAGQTFSTVLDDITLTASLMEFDELLISSMEGLVESNGQLSPSKFIYLNSVWNNTSRRLMSKPYIFSAYFYIEKAKDFIFTTESIINIRDFPDKSWVDSYFNQSKEIIYWTEVRNVKLTNSSDYSIEVVSFFRKFPFLKGQEESKGIIVVNLESKYFDNIISNIPGIQYKKIYVLDDKQATVYKNCSEPYDTYLDKESVVNLKENKNIIKKIGNQEYLISAVQSRSSEWVYISVTPTNILLNEVDSMTKVTVLITLCLLIISIILSIFYTINNYKPVKSMVSIITQYNEGKDISNISSHYNDEYSYIIYNMIKNFIDKKEIQTKLTEEKLLQNETQLYALQTQINPHFLYNTLETLNWEAIDLLGKDNSISEILIHLSSSLRYATNYSNRLVTIEEEIRQLKNYVYMLEILNQDRIKFSFDIGSSISECKMLKLLVQPLVENAILHGLSDCKSGGKIKITGKCKGTMIDVRVVDNGCGMAKNELLELRHALSSSNLFDSKSLGLRNINQRIKIKFGEQYGLRVYSKVNFGTAVHIRFPIIL